MKKEIVYTDKYALILSDEEITEQTGNDTIFNKNLNAIIAGVYDDDDNQFKVLAHLPLSDAPILKGVPLLPSFSWSQQDDVEELAEKNPEGYHESDYQKIFVEGFIVGYNKAKEKYKYTEEDVKRALSESFKASQEDYNITSDEIIQSLQQPSRHTHFECEMVRLSSNESFGLDYGSSNLKPKTITNSQGQVEVVGKYI
jgi:hypothetical protein